MSNARVRARLLARGRQVTPPLFAPLVVAAAAEIEALTVADLVNDPTRMTKALTSFQQATGVDAVVTSAADGLVAEAAGATAQWDTYPPILAAPAGGVPTAAAALRSPSRSAAAIEATRRLASTADGIVIGAALDGPATVAAQLGDDATEPAVIERAGRLVLEVATAFLEARVQLLVVVESSPLAPAVRDAWSSAINPIGNVARFRQAAPVIVLAAAADVDAVPGGTSICLHPDQHAPEAFVALTPGTDRWARVDLSDAAIVTTTGPVTDGFADVHRATDDVLDALGRVRP